MSKIRVTNFSPSQGTKSFPDGAPKREEYATSASFRKDCRSYWAEWRARYECINQACKNWDCPQHSAEQRSREVVTKARMDELKLALGKTMTPSRFHQALVEHIDEQGVSEDQYWLLMNVASAVNPHAVGELHRWPSTTSG